MPRRPNPRLLEAEGGQKTRREKHGVKAYLNTGKLPSGRAWKRELDKVSALRLALIEQYGGKDIKPSVLALLESAIEALMVQRLSGLYVKKAGVLRADSLKDGNLAVHDVLAKQFIAYANLVRLNLEAAARLAKEAPEDEVFDVTSYAQEFDKRAAKDAVNITDPDKEPETEGKDES